MTPEEFIYRLDSASVSVATFTRALDIRHSATYRWIDGSVAIPPWVGVVLDLMMECPQARAWLVEKSNDTRVKAEPRLASNRDRFLADFLRGQLGDAP